MKFYASCAILEGFTPSAARTQQTSLTDVRLPEAHMELTQGVNEQQNNTEGPHGYKKNPSGFEKKKENKVEVIR